MSKGERFFSPASQRATRPLQLSRSLCSCHRSHASSRGDFVKLRSLEFANLIRFGSTAFALDQCACCRARGTSQTFTACPVSHVHRAMAHGALATCMCWPRRNVSVRAKLLRFSIDLQLASDEMSSVILSQLSTHSSE